MQYPISNQKTINNVVFHPLTIIIINILLPTLITIFPSYTTFMFNVIYALLMLLMCKLYGRFLKIFFFLLIYIGLYHTLIYYNILINIITFMRMTNLFIPCFIMSSILISCYNSSELLSALELLRLPKLFIIALTVTIRYIPTFAKEFKIIKEAMRIRGIEITWKRPIKTWEYMIVPQLFRCLSLSNQLTIAAITKGIEEPHRRKSYFQRNFGYQDILAFMIIAIGYGVILYLN